MHKMISLGYAPVTVGVLQKVMQRNDHDETIVNDLKNLNIPEEDIPHQLLPEICLCIQSSILDKQNIPS